jgi:nucleotide-binding universal stress UspA family protein
MAEHVLVPLDGSDQAAEAVRFAFQEYPEARVTLLHVINPTRAGYGAQAGIPSFSEEWYEEAEARADDLFEEALATARPNADVETATEVGQPSHAVVEYAEEHGVDHVVMGSHGRQGVSRILLGSVAETVVRRSPVPVTVVR